MRNTPLIVTFLLSVSCMGIGSCKSVEGHAALPSHAADCNRATQAMNALEDHQANAIDDAITLMPCYDGSHAERVDVALGRMISSYPHEVITSFHKHRLDKTTVEGIVNTQPWELVDKPCAFVKVLDRRLAAINATTGNSREKGFARDSLKAFIPTVSSSCLAESESKQRD